MHVGSLHPHDQCLKFQMMRLLCFDISDRRESSVLDMEQISKPEETGLVDQNDHLVISTRI